MLDMVFNNISYLDVAYPPEKHNRAEQWQNFVHSRLCIFVRVWICEK